MIQGMACYDSNIIKLIESIQKSLGVDPDGMCDKELLSLLM